MTDQRRTRDAQDAQDELARLRAVMDALGMTEAPTVEEPDAEATEREIARIVAVPRPPAAEAPVAGTVDLAAERVRRRGPRRWATTAVGAAAAVLIAFGLSMLPQDATEQAVAAASPPLLALPIAPADLADGGGGPGHDALLELADAARRQVDPEPLGSVQHQLSQSWLTSTEVTDDGTTSTVEPTVRQSWIAADGSLVAAEWRGDPLGPQGQLEPVDTSPAGAAIDRVPAGVFPADAVARLSDDPAVLRAELLATTSGADCTGEHESYCLYSAATSLADSYVVPSRIEGALWEVLADAPGVTLVGDVTDRLGHRAVAVSVPGPAADVGVTVRVLLIDGATGRLSGREEVTLSSDVLGISEPTVTMFRYTVASDWVAEVGVPADRPAYTAGLATSQARPADG